MLDGSSGICIKLVLTKRITNVTSSLIAITGYRTSLLTVELNFQHVDAWLLHELLTRAPTVHVVFSELHSKDTCR